MSKDNQHKTQDIPVEVRDDLIQKLYDVAVDPTSYEALLDRWESMIKPLREGANSPLELGINYSSHFERADKVLDKTDISEQKISHLSHIDKSAAFLIGPDLRLLDVNTAAKSALNVKKGDRLSELPIGKDELHDLEEQTANLLFSTSDMSAVVRGELSNPQRQVVFQLQTLRQDDGPSLVVAITSEVSWPDSFDQLLTSSFQLTSAEVKILRGLTQCQSLREIALARGRSVDTVRAQLKSVLAKTGTRSQTELVRLMISMMDIAIYTQESVAKATNLSTGAKYLMPRPFHMLTLKDGRKMEYLILGDRTGKPCLYFSQDFGLVRWPASAEAQAKKRGIKLIVPVRPGYGNSSPYPKKCDLGPLLADDALQLLDHLGVKKCPVLTLGSDIFYTSYLHQLSPRRLSAVIACGGTVPLDRSEQYERMGKWHRFILASARYTPHLLPFMVKAGFSLAQRIGKRGFIRVVFGDSTPDLATFDIPEISEAIIYGTNVCISETHSAHRSFALQVIAEETTDWGPVLQEMNGSVPVHYLNGLQDPHVPIQTLREFQENHPWIDFTEFEDAGSLVFFQKWSEIIKILEKYL